MSRVSACRVCLSSELNMYAIADTPLQAVYEKLTGSELQSADARPACVCYICLHQLRKCDSFIRRAVKADALLAQLANTKSGLTKKSVDMIDKKFHNLEWMLQMLNTSTVENVSHNTFTVDFETKTEEAFEKRDDVEVKLECVKTENEYDEIDIEEHPLPSTDVTWRSSSDDEALSGECAREQLDIKLDAADSRSSTDRRKLDAEAEDEAAESADADNTSENSARQNVANYNEKTCENQRNKGPPFLILKRLNTALSENINFHDKIIKDIKKESLLNNDIITGVDSKPSTSLMSSSTQIINNSNDKKSNLAFQSGIETYNCDYCSKTFSEKNQFVNHNIRMHTGKKPYKCEHCSYSFDYIGRLKAHIRTHTGERPFKCELCTYSSRTQSTLKFHIRTHTGEKPYKCDDCSYSCKFRGDLIRHIRTHTGEKPYECVHCKYSCSSQSALQIHIRTHTGEKPYKCDDCGYSCKVRGDLIRHMRTHTGEKPYQCVHCKYSCSSQSTLQIHIRTHTGEKPYKCKHCSYSSSNRSCLKSHLLTHTDERPYRCKYCNYSAKQKSTLRTHIRIHTGERPYKCEHCSYSCSATSSLKNHLRVHTGEKSYKCKHCSFSFNNLSGFKVHMRTHTGYSCKANSRDATNSDLAEYRMVARKPPCGLGKGVDCI